MAEPKPYEYYKKLQEFMMEKQQNNLEYEKQKWEMWKETISRKTKDKDLLAKSNIEASIDKRIQGIIANTKHESIHSLRKTINNFDIYDATIEKQFNEIKKISEIPQSKFKLKVINNKDDKNEKPNILKTQIQREQKIKMKYEKLKEGFYKGELSRKLINIRRLQRDEKNKFDTAQFLLAKYAII